MANPFYIKPASMLPGFTSFLSGVESRADYEREKTKKAKQETIRKQAAGLAQSGNTDELYKLTLENPWLTDEVTKASKWHNEEIKTDAIESARRVLMGESPGQVGIEHAEKVIQAGGDATKQIEQIKQDQLEPEAAIKRAEMFLLFHDPQTYRALKGSQKNKGPKQLIVNDQLVTIGEDGKGIASQIEGLQGLDAPKSDYDRWKQNPAEFAQFRSARRVGEGATKETDAEFFRRDPEGYRKYKAAGRKDSMVAIENPDGTTSYVEGGAGRPLTAQQAKLLSDGEQLKFVLDPLEDLLTNQKELFGPVRGAVGSANPYNEKSRTADATLRRARQVVGSFMEGGVLRKEDEEKYAKMLPQLTDTPKIARNKLNGVKDLLTKKRAQLAADYESAGFDMSGQKKPAGSTPPGGGMPLPPEAASKLQAGKITVFKNGQKWTLGQNGQPQRVQ
jgi:hypothetical protein